MDQCIICWGEILNNDDGARRLSCNHRFHGECLQGWIDQNLTGTQFANLEECFKKAIACPTCSRGDATTLAGVVARALPNNERMANLEAPNDVVPMLQDMRDVVERVADVIARGDGIMAQVENNMQDAGFCMNILDERVASLEDVAVAVPAHAIQAFFDSGLAGLDPAPRSLSDMVRIRCHQDTKAKDNAEN